MTYRTLITAVTAFAISSSAFAYRAPSGTNYRAQPRVVDNRGVVPNDNRYGTSDRDLKQAIKAKRKQVKQLRKAGDPRAAQAEQDLRVLQDRQRQAHARKHDNRNAEDRYLGQDHRRDDREGDRVHGKQKKHEKDHDNQKDDRDDDEDDQDL